MIRSGLTNVQNAGYLGYPHERDPNPRNEIERPFVSLGDATILYKSDFSDPQANSTITPSPVLYADIFAKRTTADERLYVLKQIQQGLSKIQKGLLGKDFNQVPAMPLPDQPGQIIPTPPFGQQPPTGDPPGGGDGPGSPPGGGGGPGGPPGGGDGSPPDLIGASPTSSEFTDAGVNLAQEELAQDVVANPPAQTSETEEERAANEWLHMQHDPQWAQIEGRTFNTSIPSSASSYTSERNQLGPDSAGIYNPQQAYPNLAFTPESPVNYPNLTRSDSSGSPVNYPNLTRSDSSGTDGHSFGGATPRSPETTEQTQINYLNHLYDEITGLSYEQQFELFSNVDIGSRTAIGQLVLTHRNHPVSREPIFENAFFSPYTRSTGTIINTPEILTAGPRRTGSPISASSSSIASTVSSNGVGPRMRQSSRSSGSAMQVDSPPIPPPRILQSSRSSGSAMQVDRPPIPPPRRNPPAPIRTNVGRLRADNTQGVADANLNPGRQFSGLSRGARPQVLEDAIRQAGLDVTRRPRQIR